MINRIQTCAVFQLVATIKVLADISTNVLFKKEASTWVRILVVGNIKHLIFKNHKLLTLTHSPVEVLECDIVLTLLNFNTFAISHTKPYFIG
jgi:hypothetical protein